MAESDLVLGHRNVVSGRLVRRLGAPELLPQSLSRSPHPAPCPPLGSRSVASLVVFPEAPRVRSRGARTVTGASLRRHGLSGRCGPLCKLSG